MTNHAQDLITALDRLNPNIAERIRKYQPKTLTEDQASWWLDDVRLLVALVPPTDVDDAIAMLGAGCRFLAGSGADDSKPTAAWFTVTRIAAWLAQQVTSGQAVESVRKVGFRLEYLRRATLGAPVQTYVRDRRVGVGGLADSTLADVARTLTGHEVELAAWLAITGAGLQPSDLTGATYTSTPAGITVVTTTGASFPVLDEYASLAKELVGVTVTTDAWRAMQALLRDDAVHVTVTEAAATFHAHIFDGRTSVVDVVRARGIGADRLRNAGCAVRAMDAAVIDADVLRGPGIVPKPTVSTVEPDPSVSGETGSPSVAQHVSRAEAQRRLAEEQARATAVPELSETARAQLDGYVPVGIDEPTWAVVAPVHREVMARSGLKSPEAIRKNRSVLAQFLAFRHEEGESLEITKACTIAAVDAYVARGLSEFEARTRNDYQTRLDRIVRAVNPGPDAPPKIKRTHQPVRAGYTPAEEAKLRRIASNQPNAVTQRQASVTVGLACGAGLDATELRNTWVRQVLDHGDDGIEVVVTGVNARRVWVRREYEDLVRAGIAGLAADRTIFGHTTAGRNVVNGVLARVQFVEDGLTFDAARMRTTWLAWLVTRPLPLRAVLDVSGLQSARTLAEIITHLPPDPTDVRPVLRGED